MADESAYFFSEAGFHAICDKGAGKAESGVPLRSATEGIQKKGNPARWAPHIWPVSKPLMRRGRVSLRFRNLGLISAHNVDLVFDGIPGSANAVESEESRPCMAAKRLDSGEVFDMDFEIAPGSDRDCRFMYHIECQDSKGDRYYFGDGRRKILFVSSRSWSAADPAWEIYTVAPDGTILTAVTSGGIWHDLPSWSRDLSKMLYNSLKDRSSLSIYCANADGSHEKRITDSVGVDRIGSFDPTGKSIVFQSFDRKSGSDGVYSVDLDGTGLCLLAQNGTAPVYSPDGTAIAYNGQDGVYVMDSDGACKAQVSQNTGRFLAWSPDGLRLLTSRNTDDAQWYFQELWTIDIDSGAERRISSEPEAVEIDPSWSPSGSLVTYCSSNTIEGKMNLYVASVDGRRTERITDYDGPSRFQEWIAGDWYPSWSGK
jgi:Tol biopolymer transport system component